jgi:hypothetical protein
MPSHRRLAPSLLLCCALALAACGGGGDGASSDAAPAAGSGAPAAADGAPAAVELTAADVEAFERGIRRETELVREARARAAAATTPQERGDAMQAEWEDATIPEGAKSAGLPEARYRAVRATIGRVLQTLDFQGKIDGPQSVDTANAGPELRARLAGDPFAELTPASAAALRAGMDRIVPAWVEYVGLTAVAG